MHFFGANGRAPAICPERIAQHRIQVLCMVADDVKVLHYVAQQMLLGQSKAKRSESFSKLDQSHG